MHSPDLAAELVFDVQKNIEADNRGTDSLKHTVGQTSQPRPDFQDLPLEFQSKNDELKAQFEQTFGVVRTRRQQLWIHSIEINAPTSFFVLLKNYDSIYRKTSKPLTMHWERNEHADVTNLEDPSFHSGEGIPKIDSSLVVRTG